MASERILHQGQPDESGRSEKPAANHPLGIDLLDYVEQSRTPDITRHLRSCCACRQGVWNICANDEVRRELFLDVFAHRPDLGDGVE